MYNSCISVFTHSSFLSLSDSLVELRLNVEDGIHDTRHIAVSCVNIERPRVGLGVRVFIRLYLFTRDTTGEDREFRGIVSRSHRSHR